jgi:CRISPR/Cas system-associated exonuclease Cas4 (RecB family)
MAIARRSPYAWVTWLTPILAGDAQCWFAPWFKSHFQFEKLERGGVDLATWKVEHAAMVEARAARFRADGWTVYVEDQNKFTLRGTAVTLGGKPDLVAVRGLEARVVDCKGGKRRDSDLQQVLIYLFALPRYHAALTPAHVLTGEVEYRDGSLTIPPESFTPALRERIVETIRRMGADEPPRRVPSARECAFCDIGPTDCPVRIDQATTEVLVSEF